MAWNRPSASVLTPLCHQLRSFCFTYCPAVAALHAGAAIHCWPNPSAALAEISRVLRPGGVFVASTVSRLQVSQIACEQTRQAAATASSHTAPRTQLHEGAAKDCAQPQLDCIQPQPPALQFLTFSAPLGQLVGDELVAPLNQVHPTCKLLTCSLA